jgi:SH3 domain protein
MAVWGVIGRAGSRRPPADRVFIRLVNGSQALGKGVRTVRKQAVAWLAGLMVVVVGVWSAGPVRCETMYGRASCTFSLRVQPNWKANRVGHLMPGQEVTVLKKSGLWIKIQPKTGSPGWIHKNYLSATRQLPAVAVYWAKKFKDEAAKVKDLEQQMAAGQKQVVVLQGRLARSGRQLKKVTADFKRFKDANKHVAVVQAANEACQKDKKVLTADLKKCRGQAEGTTLTTNLKWFLAGAAVLLIGWIMGMAMGRSRRRRRTTF